MVWRTDPPSTDAVDRWLLEALPPADLRDTDTEPMARQTVKGDKRRATVRIDLAEEDLADAALLVVRLTAIDADGQPVLLRGGGEAVDESQQFGVRWEDDPAGRGHPPGVRAVAGPGPAGRRRRGPGRPARGGPDLGRRGVLAAPGRAPDRAARAQPGAGQPAGQD